MATYVNHNGASLGDQLREARNEAFAVRGEVGEIAAEVQRLMQTQVELARAEANESASHLTKSGIFAAAAGLFAAICSVFLFLAIMFALFALLWASWACCSRCSAHTRERAHPCLAGARNADPDAGTTHHDQGNAGQHRDDGGSPDTGSGRCAEVVDSEFGAGGAAQPWPAGDDDADGAGSARLQ